jgi:hypothetical protein
MIASSDFRAGKGMSIFILKRFFLRKCDHCGDSGRPVELYFLRRSRLVLASQRLLLSHARCGTRDRNGRSIPKAFIVSKILSKLTIRYFGSLTAIVE